MALLGPEVWAELVTEPLVAVGCEVGCAGVAAVSEMCAGSAGSAGLEALPVQMVVPGFVSDSEPVAVDRLVVGVGVDIGETFVLGTVVEPAVNTAEPGDTTGTGSEAEPRSAAELVVSEPHYKPSSVVVVVAAWDSGTSSGFESRAGFVFVVEDRRGPFENIQGGAFEVLVGAPTVDLLDKPETAAGGTVGGPGVSAGERFDFVALVMGSTVGTESGGNHGGKAVDVELGTLEALGTQVTGL